MGVGVACCSCFGSSGQVVIEEQLVVAWDEDSLSLPGAGAGDGSFSAGLAFDGYLPPSAPTGSDRSPLIARASRNLPPVPAPVPAPPHSNPSRAALHLYEVSKGEVLLMAVVSEHSKEESQVSSRHESGVRDNARRGPGGTAGPGSPATSQGEGAPVSNPSDVNLRARPTSGPRDRRQR